MSECQSIESAIPNPGVEFARGRSILALCRAIQLYVAIAMNPPLGGGKRIEGAQNYSDYEVFSNKTLAAAAFFDNNRALMSSGKRGDGRSYRSLFCRL
jgi:hypothetical protein